MDELYADMIRRLKRIVRVLWVVVLLLSCTNLLLILDYLL